MSGIRGHHGLLMIPAAGGGGGAALWFYDGSTLDGWTNNGCSIDAAQGIPLPSLSAVDPGDAARIDTGVSMAGRELRARVRLQSGSGAQLANLKFAGASGGNSNTLRLDNRELPSGIGATSSWDAGFGPSYGASALPTLTFLDIKVEMVSATKCLLWIGGVIVGLFPFTNYGTWIGVYTDSGASAGAWYDSIGIYERENTGSYFDRYRINWTSNNGDGSYTSIGEMEVLQAVDGTGADLCNTNPTWAQGTAFSGGAGSDYNTPASLFDDALGADSAYIRNGTAGFCGFHFVGQVPARSVSIRAQNHPVGVGRAPRAFTIDGSNDGVTWTTLASPAEQTGWAPNERRVFGW